jgi:DNA-binding MarR family transcriptional regulator
LYLDGIILVLLKNQNYEQRAGIAIMELYVLTQSGRKAISTLRQKGEDVDASLLEYLGMAEGATVEQFADAMKLDERIAYDKLRSFIARRWAWRKTTKLARF